MKKEEYWIQKLIQHHKWIQEAINDIETAVKLWSDRRKQIRRVRAQYFFLNYNYLKRLQRTKSSLKEGCLGTLPSKKI